MQSKHSTKMFLKKYGVALCFVFITAVYLLMMSGNFYYLVPQGSYDDGLQYRLSLALSNGHWLGGYDFLTLAKGISYPLWTTLLHTLDVPLWVGSSALYIFACLSLVFAVRRPINNGWVLAAAYALLLFNPMISVRAYRDAIAPALVLLVVAWIAGTFFALSASKKLKKDVNTREIVAFAVVGSIGLTGWWYLREDSFWILPVVLSGLIACLSCLMYKWRKGHIAPRRGVKLAILSVVPLLVVVLTGVAIASVNKAVYKRFVVNDYTSYDFEAAYGALTRIKTGNWSRVVPVSSEMRNKAYAVSPAFMELKECLDNNDTGTCEFFKHNTRVPGDYEGGWFFWALRLAVQNRGYYSDASQAEAYYVRLANEINDACDTGELDCVEGERASLTPVFDPRIVQPIIQEIPDVTEYFVGLEGAQEVRAVKLDQHTSDRDLMADYLDARYYPEELNFGARVKRFMQNVTATTYNFLNRYIFYASLLILILVTLFVKKFKAYWREILVAWGLLLILLVRVVMLTYVDVTSFPAINTLYFSSAYALLFTFEAFVLGIVAAQLIKNKRASKSK